MTLAGVATEAFFLPADPGYRFCLSSAPRAGEPVRGAILCVHAFAEEMNKSRRTVAVAARALADGGWAVLQIDLLGCGDSSGDFGDATWAAWLEDIARGYRWLEAKYRARPVIWGIRLGGLLAVQSLAKLGSQPDLILWQPVLSGRVHLAQFLRLKVAGDALGEAAVRTDTKALRQQLARGETVEIAGYALSRSLAEPMEAAELELGAGYAGRVWWCEVGGAAGASIAPASQAKIDAWRDRGIAVEAMVVGGLPFWQTQEIAECPALVEATVRSSMAVAA
jgi:exosortase A-associated hydrolase 2